MERKPWMDEIDELARKIPKWEDHWKAYKEKHPDETMPNVMKKASFTRRMWLAKEVKKIIKKRVQEIVEEIKDAPK